MYCYRTQKYLILTENGKSCYLFSHIFYATKPNLIVESSFDAEFNVLRFMKEQTISEKCVVFQLFTKN